MINPTSFYLGREVIWHDEYGNNIGPGTVLDVRPTPGNIVLSVLEHSTQLYRRVRVSHDGVERIMFSDEQVIDLPQRLLDEIRYALELGKECSVCSRSRVFSQALCYEHVLGEDETWPDFHDEDPGWSDNWPPEPPPWADDVLPSWMI